MSRRAKNALEDARERAAQLLGARPGEIVFTGGGTEADNLALKGAALARGERRAVVTSPTEHEAVLESAHFLESIGCPVRYADVDAAGVVDPSQVAELVDEDTAVVSIMAANNETGVRQPLSAIVRAVKEVADASVHTDAVQAFVSEPLDVNELGVDMLSLAAHKFGGPKGVGLLYVRSGVALEPVLHGGGQELGRRSGTHNVMGAVGMAIAMETATDDRDRFRQTVLQERDDFELSLSDGLPRAERTVPSSGRLVQHAHIRIPGVRNETMLVRLDDVGVAASAGSACQSGAATVSHVLESMGLTADEARECLRFTFGWTSEPGEGQKAAELVIREVQAIS